MPQPHSVSHLVQDLLWRRNNGEQPRPQPVVVLLGPSGSGKTHALTSLSRDCDAGVVHARLDFSRPTAPDHASREPATVEVLAQLAFELSRRWRHRRDPRFTRFAIGMLAVQTQLDGLTRPQAEKKLRDAIDDFARHPNEDAIASGVTGTLDLVGGSIAETIRNAVPFLVRTIVRKPLGRAKRWHADIPQAEGAEPIDALIRLSGADVDVMTGWLTDAFLADVRASYPRTAAPDLRNPCTCAENSQHLHNWPVMLDNIDHPGGDRFMADLLCARDRHLQRAPHDHDPLLLITTSGRWHREWEIDWCPPWRTDEPARARTVPRCRDASYQHWAGDSATERRPRYYPVLLDPLTIDGTARLLGVTRYDPVCEFVHRASGGLPAAVELIAPLVRDRQPPPGARDVLTSADPWRARLEQTGLTRQHIEIDELISAAAFATAPWLVPDGATALVSHPRLGQILTELRTSLWVIAPTGGGATSDYAELHPWLARTLVSALAERSPSPGLPSYTDQFTALLEDPDTSSDPVREAYCRLALGRLGDVAAALTDSFDTEPHRAWTDRLRLVTRAPDDLPLTRCGAELYDELVHRHVPERPPVGNIVTRLVAAGWLAANPFAMPDPKLRRAIADAYLDLRPLSRRPDVGDLHE